MLTTCMCDATVHRTGRSCQKSLLVAKVGPLVLYAIQLTAASEGASIPSFLSDTQLEDRTVCFEAGGGRHLLTFSRLLAHP